MLISKVVFESVQKWRRKAAGTEQSMKQYDGVGGKIRLIHNQIKKVMEQKRETNEGNLTAMQRWMLGFLEMHADEEICQRDIEAAFSISRATASNMLRTMESRELIARVPVAHDARLKQVVLTEKAGRIKRQAKQDVREMEELLVSGLSEEELAVLHRCLDRMLKNLGAEQEETTRCCGRWSGEQKEKKITKKTEEI